MALEPVLGRLAAPNAERLLSRVAMRNGGGNTAAALYAQLLNGAFEVGPHR